MKRISALICVLCLLLAIVPSGYADGQIQHEYSSDANSGIRHEICTTLQGTSAQEYYGEEYAYDILSTMESNALLDTLRTLLTSTHTHQTSYNNCRDLAVKTDCENGDGVTISLIYTGYSATWADWCNNRTNGWDREHVWPKSLGGFGNGGAGADLHHVRPSDSQVNNNRGNKLYGNVADGKQILAAGYTGSLVGGTSAGNFFEPQDNVKGDVARICLYLYVRYGGELSACSDITNVFESVDVLLSWCALDPVDTWEMGRNEVVAKIQGNRNVFIDYPELAWLLFDREIPKALTTPTSGAGNDPSKCPHESTTLQGTVLPSCSAEGYSGDAFCDDCGQLITPGSALPATDAHVFGDWSIEKEATETVPGVQNRSCTVCGLIQRQEIPAIGSSAADPGQQEDDYLWLVFTVIGVGLCVAAVLIVLQTKNKDKSSE